jgi:hypothetical protein
MKSIIYYTNNRIDEKIMKMTQELILKAGLPIVSCSLRPIDFGKNIVLNLERGVHTMYKQILTALEASEADYIFFCEHDVLYHPTHFDFTTTRDDVFYYNTNVWRWDWGGTKIITYDHLVSVSGMCVNRLKAIEHYRKRLETIVKKGYDKLPSHNPAWARAMGYEPGKKTGELIEEWKAEQPNIDIRHGRTITPIKMTLDSFTHQPTGWKESTIDQLWISPFLN